jgi:MFS family permease
VRYRWAVLAAGTTAQASFSTVTFALAVLAPALRDEYDLTLTQIGVVLAAEWIGLTFSMLPWGFAADRYGERWTLAAGLAGCSACLAGAAFAPSYEALVALLLLAGACGGAVQSGRGRAVMGWFQRDERGLALGVRQTAVPVGGLIAAVAIPLLGGAQDGLLFLSALVLAGAVVGALVLRSGAVHELEASDVESTLRDRRLWLVCAASGLYVVPQVALMGFAVLFLHDERGFTTADAAAVLAVSQLLAAALRIGVGRWSDVIGSRVRPLRLIGLAVAATVTVVAAAATTDAWLLVPAIAVATALSMAWNGLSFTIAAEIGGRRSGAAIGIQQTALAATGVVVPIAFAAAVSGTSWQAAFLLAAIFPLVGWWTLRPLAGH